MPTSVKIVYSMFLGGAMLLLVTLPIGLSFDSLFWLPFVGAGICGLGLCGLVFGIIYGMWSED